MVLETEVIMESENEVVDRELHVDEKVVVRVQGIRASQVCEFCPLECEGENVHGEFILPLMQNLQTPRASSR